MPRHGGHTPNRTKRRIGHRMHRRSKAARQAARRSRPTGAWDRETWLDRIAAQVVGPDGFVSSVQLMALAELESLLSSPQPTFGRKNKPPNPPTPQKPKEQGRGGRGGKGGKPK